MACTARHAWIACIIAIALDNLAFGAAIAAGTRKVTYPSQICIPLASEIATLGWAATHCSRMTWSTPPASWLVAYLLTKRGTLAHSVPHPQYTRPSSEPRHPA